MEQALVPQLLLPVGKLQLSDVLSQRPPQVASVEFVHAARPPTGCPEATRLHVPVLLLQVWHCPGQLVWQQTPSGEQMPVEHSVPVAHVFPVPFPFFSAQLPAGAQYWPVGQDDEVQAPAHFPLPSLAHKPAEHVDGVWVEQVPLPLQTDSGVC